jgi:hypothetical protein
MQVASVKNEENEESVGDEVGVVDEVGEVEVVVEQVEFRYIIRTD